MNQPRYILSPCGTSLWTNGADEVERKLLTTHANVGKPEEVPEADRVLLQARMDAARAGMLTTDGLSVEEQNKIAARKSAELNGILKLCGGTPAAGQDYHLLLCTDTWLGEQSALLVADWLRMRHVSVEVKRQRDLQTRDLAAFRMALSELVQWAETTLNAYRESRYKIVFNLTGGFKSVQGFLQSLGMFYADETVYIFENSTDLLRIPRLPVRLATEETVREHLQLFRRLNLRLPVPAPTPIPETLLLEYEEQTELSVWGQVAWEQARRTLYREKVWPSPSEHIRFGERFLASVQSLPPDRCFIVNQQLDELARFFESKLDSKYNLSSLDFKELRGNPIPPATHELDAWHDLDARRVFGHFAPEEASSHIFILDRLDKALH